MKAEIINRGRGPEIAGTRITVENVLDYHLAGRHHTYIASMLGVTSDQVLAAISYFEEHRDEVMESYRKGLERMRQPYPPEVQAKVDAAHAKFQALLASRRAARAE